SPCFLAGSLIHSNDERRRAVLFIALNDYKVAINDRRCARAHSDSSEFAKVGLPLQLAIHAVGVQSFGSEERIDIRAVRRRSRSGVRTLPVSIVVGRAVKCSLRPNNLAGLSIERNHLELMLVISNDAVGMKKFFIAVHVFD